MVYWYRWKKNVDFGTPINSISKSSIKRGPPLWTNPVSLLVREIFGGGAGNITFFALNKMHSIRIQSADIADFTCRHVWSIITLWWRQTIFETSYLTEYNFKSLRSHIDCSVTFCETPNLKVKFKSSLVRRC